MTLHHPRRLVTLVLALALLLPLGGALASEDADGEEAEAANGPLEIEARPSVVEPGQRAVVEAEYEVEADDDGDEGDDDSEDGRDDDSDDSEDGDDDDDDSEDGDDDSTDERAGEDGSERDSSDDDGDAGTLEDDAESRTAGVPSSATFSVQWGSATTPETMTVTEAKAEEDEFKSEAVTSRILEETGTVEVTVTVTPDQGEAVSATVLLHVGQGASRLSGDDRLGTSIDVARESFPEDGSADAVLLARADAFADALPAASLALVEDAPILLSSSHDVPGPVLDEIDRALGESGTVYLLGGESALSPAVSDALTSRGHSVERLAGDDRVGTALRIAEFLARAREDLEEVVLASAGDYPDALSAAPFAADAEEPVLLTAPDQLDGRVADFLERHSDTLEKVRIAGGPAAISEQVAATLAGMGFEVERLGGDTRYGTSAEIADELFSDASTVVLATGGNFADALAGAAHAGRDDAPVLLVGDELPDSVRGYLEEHAGEIEVVYTLGGDAAVPEDVRREVSTLLELD